MQHGDIDNQAAPALAFSFESLIKTPTILDRVRGRFIWDMAAKYTLMNASTTYNIYIIDYTKPSDIVSRRAIDRFLERHWWVHDIEHIGSFDVSVIRELLVDWQCRFFCTSKKTEALQIGEKGLYIKDYVGFFTV